MSAHVEGRGSLPTYLKIRNQLREQILRGDLSPGTRLRSERELAHQLGVSRTTIVSAYDELMAEGLVEARPGRGTVVIDRAACSGFLGGGGQPVPWQALFSAIGQKVQRSAVAELVAFRRVADRPGIISFALGAPDLTLLAADRLRLAIEAVLSQLGAESAGNVPIQGVQVLREAIVERLRPRNMVVDPDGVMVLHGSTQG